ncbi:phosphatidylserine decarboxylase [Candidatus Aminicenantes bacterium AC-335-G13]|nr:phosphatidylserine decarboxylase [Candidatus Aminicenantes bacterium AC-335-G13]
MSIILNSWIISIFFLLLSFQMIFFFRDPKRNISSGENLILSPADGKIIKIEKLDFHPYLNKPTTVISIFLSLFDVHITRSPINGYVRKMEYKKGKFFPAYKDKAQEFNSSVILFIENKNCMIAVKHIAGIIARKIKCWIKENDYLKSGEKTGLIYFGSRVDLFLPSDILLKVDINQKVKAGETIIGELK